MIDRKWYVSDKEEGKRGFACEQSFRHLPTMLSRWVYESIAHGEEAFSGDGVAIRNMNWEIKWLQNCFKGLKMENEILNNFRHAGRR